MNQIIKLKTISANKFGITVKNFPILSTSPSDRQFKVENFMCPDLITEREDVKRIRFRNGIECLLIDGLPPIMENDETYSAKHDKFLHGIVVNIEGYHSIIQYNTELSKTISVLLKDVITIDDFPELSSKTETN